MKGKINKQIHLGFISNIVPLIYEYGHTLGRRLGSAAQFPPHIVGSVHIACLLLRARSAYSGLSQ
jgi:hypothetical protein